MNIRNLCTPAFIYFVIAIIGVLTTLGKNGIVSGLISLLFVLFYTWILNYLCKKGHKGVAWFILFLPFIIGFFVVESFMKK
jgi:hypothetical protein